MDPLIAVIDPGLVALVTAILGGGAGVAYAAFKKAGPEVESISVETMRGVIKELRVEREELRKENQHLRATVNRLEEAARKAEILAAENETLHQRLKRLEQSQRDADDPR